MKKAIFAILAIAIISCNNDSESNEEVVPEQEVSTVDSRHPEWVKSANIYEVNVRQYSESGTLKDFAKDLPRLKEMGVDILWSQLNGDRRFGMAAEYFFRWLH